jgi:hypothetical protein
MSAGVVLGLIVGVWMFIYGFAGFYKSQQTGWLFIAGATLIEIGVLIWGLKKTVAEGKRYGGQLVAGLLICLIGGVIIIVFSMVWTAVFPDVFEVTEALTADRLADTGLSEEQIEAQMAATAFTRTPLFSAISGFIGTMFTGLIISLITAAFIRVKD